MENTITTEPSMFEWTLRLNQKFIDKNAMVTVGTAVTKKNIITMRVWSFHPVNPWRRSVANRNKSQVPRTHYFLIKIE